VEAQRGTNAQAFNGASSESHLRTHILPTMGEMSLTAINTRNVQAFISALTAKGLTS
jgi:hypothetical protein